MRRVTFILTLLCVVSGRAGAQEPVNTGSIQDIYLHLSGVIAKAESVDFRGTHHVSDTEIGVQANRWRNNDDPRTLDGDIHFQGRGTRYCYTERYSGENSGNPRANALAWDGKYYQVLDLKAGYLLISKQDPDHNHLRMGPCSALKMFDFLVPQSPAGCSTVGWDLVKNLAAWKACLANARLVGPTSFHGKPCSMVTIANAEYRALHPAVPRCTYTVCFSWNDGMFPVAWKLEDEHRRVLEDYEVEEFGQATFGEGQVFYYPAKAKGAFYPDRDFPPGKPGEIYTSACHSFALGTIKDDEPFTIDRARAREVFNRDTGVATSNVPPVRAPDEEAGQSP